MVPDVLFLHGFQSVITSQLLPTDAILSLSLPSLLRAKARWQADGPGWCWTEPCRPVCATVTQPSASRLNIWAYCLSVHSLKVMVSIWRLVPNHHYQWQQHFVSTYLLYYVYISGWVRCGSLWAAPYRGKPNVKTLIPSPAPLQFSLFNACSSSTGIYIKSHKS